MTEDMSHEMIVGWNKLNKLQSEIMAKHPNVSTSLILDKLIMDDKMLSWDPNKKKVKTSPLYYVPNKSKNR